MNQQVENELGGFEDKERRNQIQMERVISDLYAFGSSAYHRTDDGEVSHVPISELLNEEGRIKCLGWHFLEPLKQWLGGPQPVADDEKVFVLWPNGLSRVYEGRHIHWPVLRTDGCIRWRKA